MKRNSLIPTSSASSVLLTNLKQRLDVIRSECNGNDKNSSNSSLTQTLDNVFRTGNHPRNVSNLALPSQNVFIRLVPSFHYFSSLRLRERNDHRVPQLSWVPNVENRTTTLFGSSTSKSLILSSIRSTTAFTNPSCTGHRSITPSKRICHVQSCPHAKARSCSIRM